MSKAILTIGYTNYVMDVKDCVAVAEILSKAELYESKYQHDRERTQHIFANDKEETGTVKLISDDMYRMAKLAGKPAKD